MLRLVPFGTTMALEIAEQPAPELALDYTEDERPGTDAEAERELKRAIAAWQAAQDDGLLLNKMLNRFPDLVYRGKLHFATNEDVETVANRLAAPYRAVMENTFETLDAIRAEIVRVVGPEKAKAAGFGQEPVSTAALILTALTRVILTLGGIAVASYAAVQAWKYAVDSFGGLSSELKKQRATAKEELNTALAKSYGAGLITDGEFKRLTADVETLDATVPRGGIGWGVAALGVGAAVTAVALGWFGRRRRARARA